MAIGFVGYNSAAATSVSLPSFATDDVALAIGYGTGLTITPAAGWTQVLATSIGSTCTIAWRALQSGDTSTGEWANASHMQVVVYSGVNTTYPISAKIDTNTNTTSASGTTDITPLGLTRPGTRERTVVSGWGNVATDVDALSFAGTTNRSSGVGTNRVGLVDVDGSFTQATYTTNFSNTQVRSVTLALREENTYVAAANAHTVVTTGWTNPSNAFAYPAAEPSATATPGKNATVNGDFGFADVLAGSIPDNSTINAVRISGALVLSATVTGGIAGIQGRVSGANSGSEATTTETAFLVAVVATLGAVTLANLRSASTVIKGRTRATKGSTNSALTVTLQDEWIEVDFTPPAAADSPYPYIGAGYYGG